VSEGLGQSSWAFPGLAFWAFAPDHGE